MTHFESLTSPSHLYTRAEVLSKPSPVPSASGVYAWFFKEIPGIVPTDGCVTKDGLTLLYVGISPKNESSSQNIRKRIKSHYQGNAEGSTLRLTLGVLLEGKSGFPLRRVGSGKKKDRFTLTHLGEQWLDAGERTGLLDRTPRPVRYGEGDPTGSIATSEPSGQSGPSILG